MRNLTLVSLTTISLLLLNGCSSTSMASYTVDKRLPKLNNVKSIPNNTSVAFEWQPMATKGLDGINIYRTGTDEYVHSQVKELKLIKSIKNPFSSHYVDSGLRQNSNYTYTFTTIKGKFESLHGQVVKVKTLRPLDAVTFFQGFQKAQTTIKLIWRPHLDKRIKMYKIEKSINGGEWKWVGTEKNRMMSEYIDTRIAPGNVYTYRVIAVGFDDSLSKPSKPVVIKAR